MSRLNFAAGLVAGLALASSLSLSAAPAAPDAKPAGDAAPEGRFEPFKPESVSSTGTVSIGGQTISYQAIAGTLIVHPKDWDDVPRDPKTEKENSPPASDGDKNPTAEASIFYVAYFKTGGGPRPVTFLYN